TLTSHTSQLEDIWIHFRDEYIIRQRDYERLDVDEIFQYGIAEIPTDFQDDGEVLDEAYKTEGIANQPLPWIDWYQEECSNTKDRVGPILQRTYRWLATFGIKPKGVEQ
ncbi:hypothetical protein KI387_039729, partial [Taxus chinensis]